MSRKNRPIPEIQSGSVADIAFLLLIFFMVCTTFQREKSIPMVLPPPYDGPAGKVNEDRVLSLIINADNQVMIEGQAIDTSLETTITQHLRKMVSTKTKPYINIKLHESSDYEHYINVLAKVKASINNLKKFYALQKYDKSYNQLSKEQYTALSKMLSITITESQYAI
jgi:biopolymer transport protein ExbD